MRQIIDQNIRFTPGMIEATKAFAKSKPWRGTVSERIEKFRTYHEAVAKENDLPHSLVVLEETIGDVPGTSTGAICNVDEAGLPTHERTGNLAIVLAKKLSVVTYLFLVGSALGYEKRKALKFAVNLFKQRFPLSFSACRFERGLLIR